MTSRPADDRLVRTDRLIAILFIVGSSLFALGAVPFYSEAAGLRVTALTFFVGSLFFTAAAFRSTARPSTCSRNRIAAQGTGSGCGRRATSDWLACAVQFAGTLWFNWSTGNALRLNIDAAVDDQRVWRPDAFGSVSLPGGQRAGVAGRQP